MFEWIFGANREVDRVVSREESERLSAMADVVVEEAMLEAKKIAPKTPKYYCGGCGLGLVGKPYGTYDIYTGEQLLEYRCPARDVLYRKIDDLGIEQEEFRKVLVDRIWGHTGETEKFLESQRKN